MKLSTLSDDLRLRAGDVTAEFDTSVLVEFVDGWGVSAFAVLLSTTSREDMLFLVTI